MIRDFTDTAKQELFDLVKQTEDEKICNVTDWFGDRWYDFQEWIGVLKLESDLSNVNAYHKKIIDKNNQTVKDIEKIFNNVYSVEYTYNVKLNNVMSALKAYNVLLSRLTDIILPQNGKFTVEQINSLLKSEAYIGFLKLMEAHVGQFYDYEIFLKELQLKDKITDEDKEKFIQLYEAHYADQTVQIDKFMSKLTDEQIREIKYIIYSAEEPYRSIYLDQLGNYTIGYTKNGEGGMTGGYFTTGNNTINVKMEEEADNPLGPYTTFFHESGHALDYNYNDDGKYYSLTFRDSQGQSIQEALYADVENNISNVVGQYTTDETVKNHIMEYIMGHDIDNINNLSKAEKKILENVSEYYRKQLGGAKNSAPSDVYGGVTNNIIVSNCYHDGENYWYDSEGNPTGRQSKELWAEFYAYKSTGNQAALDSIRQYFPSAYKCLEEMAESMVNQ